MDVWFSTDEVTFPDFLVHVLSGVLAFTTTLSLLMGFLVCKMNKGNQSLVSTCSQTWLDIVHKKQLEGCMKGHMWLTV